MEQIWQIIIYCENGSTYTLFGDGNLFQAELRAWHEYSAHDIQEAQEAQASFAEDYVDGDGFQVRTLQGFSHEFGQLSVTVGYRFNEVVGITVLRVR